LSKDSWLEWYKGQGIEEGVGAFAETIREANMSRVLDFGCGTGRHTAYLASMGFEVYGFDWSEAAVERARLELARHELGANLKVWDMNETPLPYRDSFFDAVIVVKVFHHTYIEKTERIASEIERITRSSGYLYVEVPTYEKAVRQKLEGAKSEEPEPGTFVPSEGDEAGIPHHHFKRDELLRLFPNFTRLNLEEKNEHLCFTATRN
jgi:SAM-dependent methyltransferase